MNFISQVMSQISGQIFAIDGVYVDNDVNLRSVDLGYAIFLTNWNQVQDGIQVGFHVRVETGPWFGVDGRFIIQAYTYGQGPDITYEDEDGMTYTIPGLPLMAYGE